jgi:hypothetical protein
MISRTRAGITLRTVAIAVSAAASLATATISRGGEVAQTETQKLLASDGAEDDRYGMAVARQGKTLIIGAPQSFGNALRGSFYVLALDGAGHWIERERVLSPFDPGGVYGDEFGAEVALDGDTLLVGAPLTNPGGPLSGYAYAYSRDENRKWTLSQGFPPPSTGFGSSIALVGDRAVIASNSEAIVVARDGSGQWSQEAALSADTVATTVAFDGATIVVAGRFSNLEIGAVLFVHQDGEWSPSATISMPTEPSPGSPYMLVRDVSIEGNRLALGITNLLGPDRALVYERDASSGEWIEKAALDPDSAEGDGFGVQVALRNRHLLVGASSVGKVYVYRRSSSGEWTEIGQLVPSDPFFGQQFGRAVHFGDGDAVVGATDHENGLHAGAAYVFDLAPTLALVEGF